MIIKNLRHSEVLKIQLMIIIKYYFACICNIKVQVCRLKE